MRWFDRHIQTEQGKPYDHRHYPHIGAPGGPADALDDPAVQTIILQWGTRLGKTFFAQCALLKTADTNPGNGMIASVDDKLAHEIAARTTRMYEHCDRLAGQLRPPHRRSADRIDFDACHVDLAWSRSVSTLADKDLKFGHAHELPKWVQASTSKEADPEKLYDERFKDNPSHKSIKEGTPTVKKRCRIERARLGSTNCKLWVPCPHCGRYQVLRMGKADEPGGIVWQKLANGKHDPDLARRTAHYVCAHCNGRILDVHRARMMRRGVWCPEGCTVNDQAAAEAVTRSCADLYRDPAASSDPTHPSDEADDPDLWRGWSNCTWIRGRPARDDRDAGYQLSSLYAIRLGWGDIAREFVRCLRHPQLLRNFLNSWLAETWEMAASEQTWEQLGKRIISGEIMHAVVPEWASLLTMGIDRQGDFFVYLVDAWGPGQRHATIDYGDPDAWDALRELLRRHWPHADGGPSLEIRFALFDANFRPLGVNDFCITEIQRGRHVWPCKGSNTALEADYVARRLGPNTSTPGMVWFHVDTFRTQTWLEHTLQLDADHEAAYSLFNGSLEEHQDFLEQLLNDAPEHDLDAHGNPRESWIRIDTTVPNDFRDCKRYSYTAMLIATRGGKIRPRGEAEPTTAGTITPGRTRPDGRGWLPTRG